MQKIFFIKQVVLPLLMILMLYYVLQASTSTVFDHDPGSVLSGSGRTLRIQPSPPSPMLGRSWHFKYAPTPPPPPEIGSLAPPPPYTETSPAPRRR
ncbi:uncharacterized protein LOC128133767 [Lactuca sativa]|uniref:uncharacterized protein LOC128133767 n=1 Tax=Lactuca sativa TaxID=4236 RepID=UPI0022B03D2A|nr:uncharacterized protein LOC128133767 [Lactuca sativa]